MPNVSSDGNSVKPYYVRESVTFRFQILLFKHFPSFASLFVTLVATSIFVPRTM